jgi:hypothetical protein
MGGFLAACSARTSTFAACGGVRTEILHFSVHFHRKALACVFFLPK